MVVIVAILVVVPLVLLVVMPFVVIMIVLLIRPTGLFGKPEEARL